VLIPPYQLTFPRELGLLTRISFLLPIDGVAQEENETFAISFSGLEEGDLGHRATIIPEFTGIILDMDTSTARDVDGKAYIQSMITHMNHVYVFFLGRLWQLENYSAHAGFPFGRGYIT
jgi:hypothetical protein